MVESHAGRSWAWTSELPLAAIGELPEEIDGALFLERFRYTDDPLTIVEPSETYPVRAAATFGAEEHIRSMKTLAHLNAGELQPLGRLMAASDAAYRAMGLGHPRAAAAVAEALAHWRHFGARSSGGGCGGTVVVACAPSSLDDVEGLIH